MTATIPPASLDAERHSEPLIATPVKIVGALIAVAIVAFIAYGIGLDHGNAGPHVLTGRAYVGDTVATVNVDGWAYGLNITPNGLQWYDARGGSHDGGIPSCLQGPAGHYAWLRFGYSTAHGLHGEIWRPIDWVQCLTHEP